MSRGHLRRTFESRLPKDNTCPGGRSCAPCCGTCQPREPGSCSLTGMGGVLFGTLEPDAHPSTYPGCPSQHQPARGEFRPAEATDPQSPKHPDCGLGTQLPPCRYLRIGLQASEPRPALPWRYRIANPVLPCVPPQRCPVTLTTVPLRGRAHRRVCLCGQRDIPREVVKQPVR